MLEFLNEERSTWAEITIGAFGADPVLLVLDHPSERRCWIKVLGDRSYLGLTFSDAGLTRFREAIADALKDLESD